MLRARGSHGRHDGAVARRLRRHRCARPPRQRRPLRRGRPASRRSAGAARDVDVADARRQRAHRPAHADGLHRRVAGPAPDVPDVLVRAALSIRGTAAGRRQAARGSWSLPRQDRDRRRDGVRPLRPQGRPVRPEDVRLRDSRAGDRQHPVESLPDACLAWRQRRDCRRRRADCGDGHRAHRPLGRLDHRHRRGGGADRRAHDALRPRDVGADGRPAGRRRDLRLRRRRLSVRGGRPREASREASLLALRLEGCLPAARGQPGGRATRRQSPPHDRAVLRHPRLHCRLRARPTRSDCHAAQSVLLSPWCPSCLRTRARSTSSSAT